MRDLLSRRGFRLLLGGQVVSSFGDWMATIALMAVALDMSGSATAVAGILVLRLAPATFAGPLAARVVRRWDRRRTMMAMDLTRAGLVAIVPLVPQLWWVYVVAFLLEVCGLVYLPARDAAIPDLAGGEHLNDANSLILGASYGTIPLGAGAFAIATAATPGDIGSGTLAMAPAFWVDAATFLVSFSMVRRIGSLLPARPAAQGGPTGFLQAFSVPLVRSALPATTSAALGVGVLFSLGIVFVQDVLAASDAQFAVLIVCFSLGASVGLVLLHRYDGDAFTALWWSVAAQGAVISVMSLAPSLALTFLGAAGFGAAAAAAITAGMSFLQSHLEGDELVAAFAAFHVTIRGGLSLAAIGAGIADDILHSVDWPLTGTIPSTRLILFSAGLLVLTGGMLARSMAVVGLARPNHNQAS